MGFPQSGNGAIFRILTNPLYTGLVRVCASGKYPEKIIQAIHEPIVTQSQYWRVQDILGLKKRAMNGYSARLDQAIPCALDQLVVFRGLINLFYNQQHSMVKV